MSQLTKGIVLLSIVLLSFVAVEIPSLLNRGIDENEAITIASIAGHASLTEKEIGYDKPLPVDQLRSQIFGKSAPLGEIAQGLKEHDRYPPLYFWTSAVLGQAIGLNLTTVRILSLACGMIFIAAFSVLFWKRMTLATWFLFLVAISFSTGTAFYSTQARPYITCMAIASVLAVLASHLNSLANKRPRMLLLVITGFIAGLGFITNYFMIYPAFAVGVWLLLQIGRKWLDKIIEGAIYGVCFFAIAIYGVTFARVQVTYQPGLASGYNGPLSDLARGYDCLIKLLVYQPPYSLSLAVAVLFGAAAVFAIMRRKADPKFADFCFVFAAITIGGWFLMNLAMHKHLYQIRYMTFFLPGVWMMVGFGISQLPPSFTKAINVVLVGLILVEFTAINAPPTLNRPVYTSSVYKDVASILADKLKANPDACILLERGDERGWMAGLTYELAAVTKTPLQYIAPESDGLKVSKCSTPTVWYLIDSDIHENKKKSLLEELKSDSKFKLAREEVWGLELKQAPQP